MSSWAQHYLQSQPLPGRIVLSDELAAAVAGVCSLTVGDNYRAPRSCEPLPYHFKHVQIGGTDGSK